MYRFLYGVLLLVSISMIQAQPKIGKVDSKWVELNENPTDKDLRAEMLEDFGKIRFHFSGVFGFSTTYDYYQLINIYKKEGYSYGETVIILHKDGAYEETLESIDGYVYKSRISQCERRFVD